MLSRHAAVTGLDLGSHSIKLVRLKNGRTRTPRLTHWGREEISAGEAASPSGRAAAIRRLMARLRLRPRQLGSVATALGGRDVHLRQASMPRLPVAELRQALPYEAKKHLPLENVDDPCLDFQVLGVEPAADSDRETQEVLLVAAPRSQRDRLLDILDEAGIQPDVIDMRPLPTINAVLDGDVATGGPDLVVILDMDIETSTVAGVVPGGGLYVRPLEFAGGDLFRSALELSGSGPAEVRGLLQGPGAPTSGAMASLLSASVRALVVELEETLRFLSVRQQGRGVGRIHLCGEGSRWHGLRESLAEAFGAEVDYPNPFLTLSITDRGGPEGEEATALIGALGLARWWD